MTMQLYIHICTEEDVEMKAIYAGCRRVCCLVVWACGREREYWTSAWEWAQVCVIVKEDRAYSAQPSENRKQCSELFNAMAHEVTNKGLSNSGNKRTCKLFFIFMCRSRSFAHLNMLILAGCNRNSWYTQSNHTKKERWKEERRIRREKKTNMRFVVAFASTLTTEKHWIVAVAP